MQIKCPACYQKIGPFDRTCPCGWSQADTGLPPANGCHWPQCTQAAKTSVTTNSKRIDLCLDHYTEYHKRQSLANAKKAGLNTAEDCRAWLKANKLKTMNFPD